MKAGRYLVVAIIAIGVCLAAVNAQAVDQRTYTVQPGDTLWSITQKFYGDMTLWPKLWEINKYNTSNPHRLSVGDVLMVPPLESLNRVPAPPAAPRVQTSLYDRGQPLNTVFPRYFTYVADPSGISGSGINRIKVKKLDPLTGREIITYDEVREVGEIVATDERGHEWYDDDIIEGRLLTSFNDNVIVRFTDDLSKYLDSSTHEDQDPYFREFPIYSYGKLVREPDPGRFDYAEALGQLHKFVGKITVVSRVETLMTSYDDNYASLARGARGPMSTGLTDTNQGAELVSYVAKITYSEHPVHIGDRVFVFRSIYPGPDREAGEGPLHRTGDYRPLGP